MVKKLLLIALVISVWPAQASPDVNKLIQGCKQAVWLYQNKHEQRAVMHFVMSPADTLLAGYCKGMIESYIYSSPRMYRCGSRNTVPCCSKKNWLVIAESIGSLSSPNVVPDRNGNNISGDLEDILIYGCT